MKIWLAPNCYHPIMGGVQTVVRQLADALAAEGEHVTIVTCTLPRAQRQAPHLDAHATYRLPFSIYRGTLPSLALFAARLLPNLFKLTLLYRREKPDLLHVHYLDEQAFYLLLLHYLTNCSLVVSVHGSDVMRNYHGNPLLRFAFHRFAARADCIIANSEFLGREAVKICPAMEGKLVVIANAFADMATASDPVRPTARPYLVAVGRLVDDKGFDLLIRAFNRLIEEGVDCDLVIVGEGERKQYLRSLCAPELLGRRIVFTGQLAQEEVYGLITESLFMVLPSRNEAFGNVVVEAMALGKTVVAASVGGVPEIVRDGYNGLLVPREDVGALAAVIGRLIRDEPLRHGLEGGAVATVRGRYTVEQMYGRYRALYRRLTGSAREPIPLQSRYAMNSPVSIVIISYNRRHTVVGCIESIISTTKAEHEIIVIDDGSTDGTGDALRGYVESGQIRYLYQPNSGVSKARNAGIAKATGEFICFIDSDIICCDGAIDKLLEVMRKDDLYQVVGAARYNREELPFRDMIEGTPRTNNNLVQVAKIGIGASMVRRDIFDRLGAFDEHFSFGWEDTEFCWRATLAGYRVAYAYDAVVFHLHDRTPASRVSEERFILENTKNRLYSHLKLMPLYPVAKRVCKDLALSVLLSCQGPSKSKQVIKGVWWNVVHLPEVWNLRKKVARNRTTSYAVIEELEAYEKVLDQLNVLYLEEIKAGAGGSMAGTDQGSSRPA